MNLRQRKRTNYLLVFLLLIGVAIFVHFFIPALQRLDSERLSVAQLQAKLTEQRQAVKGFRQPAEEEKRLWNDSKQRLKAVIAGARYNVPLFSLNEELTKHAEYCDISNIIITPQSRDDQTVAPAEVFPSGVSENKSVLKISFHADYESLGRFLRWFNDHSHQASILSLNIQRAFPLISVEMDVEVRQLTCDF
ncbi:MAG: hypothetical protein ACUZ77_03785 [Candidatus Brocadiales bacterium]